MTETTVVHLLRHGEVDNPTGVLIVGPIGGLFGLVGLIAALRYPILNPVRRRAD